MSIQDDISLSDFISEIKVMYLSAYSDGLITQPEKDEIQSYLVSLSLTEDGNFLARKLSFRIESDLQDDFELATDLLLDELQNMSIDSEKGEKLLKLYQLIALSDGVLTDSEIVTFTDLADTLGLDVEPYI